MAKITLEIPDPWSRLFEAAAEELGVSVEKVVVSLLADELACIAGGEFVHFPQSRWKDALSIDENKHISIEKFAEVAEKYAMKTFNKH